MTSSESAYAESAEIYDLIYEFKDFPGTADALREFISQHHGSAKRVIDIACGTGRHLDLLGDSFDRSGLDRSSEMLAIARARVPEIDFYERDMADFDLGQTFDVVMCLFSSVAYVRTVDRLRSALASMSAHLAPGGLIIVEPWISPESYHVGRLVVNHARDEERAVTWMYRHELVEACSRFDITYLIGDQRRVRTITERHEMGLFTQQEYEEAFRHAGLEPRYDASGLFGRGMFWALR